MNISDIEHSEIASTLKTINDHDLKWLFDHLFPETNANEEILFPFGITPISQKPGNKTVKRNLDWLQDSVFIEFSAENEILYTPSTTIFTFVDFKKRTSKGYHRTNVSYGLLKVLKSRSDYDKEKILENKQDDVILWDNSKSNNIKSGYIFGFCHASKQENHRVEFHFVEDANNQQPRRSWWSNRERDVLTLSNESVTLPISTLKEWMVNGRNEKTKEKLRIVGTQRYLFNKQLKFTIQCELARRNNNINELEARIWDIKTNPVDKEIYEIVKTEAEKINELVGYEKIFENQIHNAAVSCQILLDKDSHLRAILGADTQSGKSGASELLSQSIRKVLIHRNLISKDDNIGCLFILHISDSNLKNQNEDRLISNDKGSYHGPISKGVFKSMTDEKVYMATEMLSGGAVNRINEANGLLISKYKCKKIILISDEIQSAMTVGQQISGIYDKLGVHYDQQDILIFGTTATATRYYNQTYDKKPLTVYWGENGSNYYGINDMDIDNKLRHLGNISNEALLQHVEENIIPNKYILVRDNGVKRRFWENLAQQKNIEIKNFICSEGNISTLNKQLRMPPSFYGKENMILMVKMGYRAGNTIDHTKHVSVAFDSFSGDEPVIQSFPGRFSGNQHNRGEDCPIVYTNLPKVRQYLIEREIIKNGHLPEVSINKKIKLKKAKVLTPPKIECVELNSKEYIAHKEMLETKFKDQNFAVNWCDDNISYNFAKMVLNSKWKEPFRALGLKDKTCQTGKFVKHIRELVKNYPKLSDSTTEYVLIATNVKEETGRKRGNSVLQTTN